MGIKPIALYGSEIWGPLAKKDFSNWDKHLIETLHMEFCRYILKVQRKTPNNACRAELGQFPLLIDIQKRAISFHRHLKNSDPSSYHYQALQCQEQNVEKSPLSQLVRRLTPNTPHPQNSPLTTRPNQATIKLKENYITYWKNAIKKQSKLECYTALNREYTMADYLTTITDSKLRKTMTKYRISDHSLAIETGRHRQTSVPREDRRCSSCPQGEVETELHFLLHCDKYKEIRASFIPKIIQKNKEFETITDTSALQYILGEKLECTTLAAHFVWNCHQLRDSQGTGDSSD